MRNFINFFVLGFGVMEKEVKKVFEELEDILKKLQEAENDILRKEFEDAFKKLRGCVLENKKFMKWLKKHHRNKINSTNLAYGVEHLDKLFSKVTNILMDMRKSYNEKEYTEVLNLIREAENLVIWEIKSEEKFVEENVGVVQLTSEEVLKKVREVDRQLVKLIEKYGISDPLNFISITNKEVEKQKFFESFNRGLIYNPMFSYKLVAENVLSNVEEKTEDLMKQLRDLKLDFTQGAPYLVEKKRINMQIILKLVRSIGTQDVTKYSMQLYGFPSDELVSEAYEKLREGKEFVEQKLDEKLDEKRYSVEDFVRKTDNFFKENNMNWKTIIKTNNEMAGRFSVSSLKRELSINKDSAPFSERDIIKCIEHEIQVHALRSEMGRKSPLNILAYGTSGYLPTEEGLTTYFEDLKNAGNPILTMKKYLYVICIYLASKGSFYDCFSQLVGHGVEPETSWEVVVRIKRGLKDTSQKGGFFKDHVYFLGDKLIRQFVTCGGKPEDLLGGKISIRDVKHLVGKYKL